ncbi:MAG: hypothetical protein ACKVZH_02200, partial [Blastocatellia bacterium]
PFDQFDQLTNAHLLWIEIEIHCGRQTKINRRLWQGRAANQLRLLDTGGRIIQLPATGQRAAKLFLQACFQRGVLHSPAARINKSAQTSGGNSLTNRHFLQR